VKKQKYDLPFQIQLKFLVGWSQIRYYLDMENHNVKENGSKRSLNYAQKEKAKDKRSKQHR
jgi:hypothetical protein